MAHISAANASALDIRFCKNHFGGIPDSQRAVFEVFVPIVYIIAAVILLFNAALTAHVILKRVAHMKAIQKRGSKKTDLISLSLFFCVGSCASNGVDSIIMAVFVSLCRGMSEAEPGDQISSTSAVIGRSLGYGGLILGLLTLISAWNEILIAAGSFGRKRRSNVKLKLTIGAIFYALSMGAVCVMFYAGMHFMLVAGIAASFVSLYLVGIAWFALRWGKSLAKLLTEMSKDNQEFQSKTKSESQTQLIVKVKKLAREIGMMTLWFLGCVFVLGGGQSTKNGWVLFSSLVGVYICQCRLVQSVRKSASLGTTSKSRIARSASASSVATSVSPSSLASTATPDSSGT